MKFALTQQDRRLLGQVLKFSQARKTKLYIVGGLLRDMILRRKSGNLDIDFALKKNAIAFAASLARHLKSGFVVLDKDNGCARLVKKSGGKVYTLDITDFRGRDLLQDLGRRDFSINTLAVELKTFLEDSRCRLIDPYQGLKDLKSGIIRAVSSRAFDDDPLRILRAFSLSCILDFKIKPATLELARQKKNKLKTVSFERIRDELFKIFASSRAYESLRSLDRYAILELIIPRIKAMQRLNQGPYHHLDVWQHTLETIKQLEKVIRDFSRNQDIQDYLNQEISSGRRRLELIKLGALLHDVGKPKTLRIEEGKVKFHGHERVGAYMAEEAARLLKLSNDEIAVLKKMILFHLRPGYLAANPALTPRARFRFFRDAAREAASVLLISLADQRATRGALTTDQSRQRHERLVRRLIRDYFRKTREKKTPRLVNGNDLIKHFGLEPSPLIGKVLREIEEARAIGKVKTKPGALKLAARMIKKEAKK